MLTLGGTYGEPSLFAFFGRKRMSPVWQRSRQEGKDVFPGTLRLGGGHIEKLHRIIIGQS
jgi:hypothetical protein